MKNLFLFLFLIAFLPSFAAEQADSILFNRIVKKNADDVDYVYRTDRVLINTNKKQLYGTQTRLDKEKKKYIPLPISDKSMVDKHQML